MIGLAAAGVSDGVLMQAASLDLGRGAIAGAFIVAAAFLAGYAAMRRSGAAGAALAMVLMAAALEFSWLGFLPSLPAEGSIFLLGLFAASCIVFLSTTIGAAQHNPLLGGVMFTAALILAGLGVINFVDRVDAAALMRLGAMGVGMFTIGLAVLQAFRGDHGARLIIPGAALAIIAPLVGPLGPVDASAAALAPHGLFALGVLAASLVGLTEGAPAPRPAGASPSIFRGFDAEVSHSHRERDDHYHHHHHRRTACETSFSARRERAEVVIDSQLGRVLDYSGVAIWDWSEEMVDQTESLPQLLGADSDALFTPDALRQFVHRDDMKLLETTVLAAEDGPFDVTLKLFDGRRMRVRGARAAAGAPPVLERVVAFFEAAAHEEKVVASPADAPAKSSDFDVDAVVAAFQPIVSLNDMRTVGFEALARLEGEADGNTAALIRAAAHAGQSGALALSMLRQAAAHLAEQHKGGKSAKTPFVAMNVSWTQMKDPAFIDAVADVIRTHNLPRGALVLELTEGEAIGESAAAAPVFRKLKALGAALAFDDFGAGFSCLSNVRQYDFDYIKIDKSFTDDLDADGDGAKIVAALAGLGKSLGLKVIIEGLESKSAAKTALGLGCAYGQGFALGKPDLASASRKPSSQDAKSPARASKPSSRGGATSNPRPDKTDAALELTQDFAAPASKADGGKDDSMRWMRRRRF